MNSPAQFDSSDESSYSPNRRKSTSFLAVKEAVYQLTCLNDFTCEELGAGFFADVYKVRQELYNNVGTPVHKLYCVSAR